MKIVHCITGLTADGAQRMLLRLAERLQQRGFENHVISLSGPEAFATAFRERGIKVYSLGLKGSFGDVCALRRGWRLIHQISPSVLQGWMYHGNLALSLLRPLLAKRTPLAWNIRRGMDDFRERKFLTRFMVRANSQLSSIPERVVFCTRESRVQHEEFGFCRENGQVLGNGFDTDTFCPRPELRIGARKQLQIQSDEIVIGNVGRYDISKGRGFLFEAFSELVKVYPQARLLLVGRGMDARNEELVEKISAYGIGKKVSLLGERRSMTDIYPAMDILCSSSVAEGFPNVIAEAMASGIPCIATDAGNSRELLEGVGMIVQSRSGEDLARGLIEMCREGPVGWGTRGLMAHERIERKYSLSRVADEYAVLYQELASR